MWQNIKVRLVTNICRLLLICAHMPASVCVSLQLIIDSAILTLRQPTCGLQTNQCPASYVCRQRGTARNRPQSPAAIHCCSSRSIPSAHWAHSSKPAADRSTDTVGYYFIIDHAPHAGNADKLTECSSSTEDAVAAADG